jgi:aminopeptidase N
MSPLVRLLAAAAVAAAPLAACGPGPGKTVVADAAVAPLLTTPEALDDLTFAQPQVARVTHVDLDLAVDFAAKTVGGTAALDVLAKPDAKDIVLDTDGLTVSAVTDAAGKALPFNLGAPVEGKGAPLTVTLNGAKRIVVTYRSSPEASALQWLPAELTFGKKQPMLYSQGQPRDNRSWIPTQDSPGIRQSWTARIVVPQGMTAVMSGEKLTPKGEAAGPGKTAFKFAMPHPTAPYLIAIGVGDIAFKALGPRTGLYTEPGMIDRAAAEMVDNEKMMIAAEQLYGPYRWGRYDVLVLPPAFPYGGMENTTLTFLTPTFITGDRANVGLVAHELAHSWSGNLVTNATWRDIWLNEGFTSYVENRLMEALYGPARAEIEADLSWEELQKATREAKTPEEVTLFGDKTTVEYIKGEAFLRTMEHIVGREKWDAYLRGYFDRHAFQPQTTAGFLADLRANLIKGDAALEQRMMLDEWIYKPTIPANAYHKASPALAAVDAQVAAFVGGAPAASLPSAQWTTQEWQRFLRGLPRKLTPAQMADLNTALKLNEATNAYVRAEWLQLVVANRWTPGLASLERFLGEVGRGLFIYPLYTGLMEQGDWGKALARQYFAKAGGGYHPGTRARIEKTVKG